MVSWFAALCVSFLPGLLASRFRPVGSPRSLLTGRRPVRMVRGISDPARLEAGGSALKLLNRNGRPSCDVLGDAPEYEPFDPGFSL